MMKGLDPACLAKGRAMRLSFAFVALLLLASCAAVDPSPPLHAIELRNTGPKAIRDLEFTYGGTILTRIAGFGPGGIVTDARTLPIPDAVRIRWTPSDGRPRGLEVPLRGRLPQSMQRKGLLFEINEDAVEVFLSANMIDFRDRNRIYSARAD